ncbi:HAMP domain-containing sensor histidine kinase [Adlercreutzia sp. ZJ141]|uniref:HAMP domain-containing sensor histidine kinase n=1 Tax=Adlercreutzia sp. ZJ141 TaxID=2709406 RepID=UPI0013ED6CFE|nr:HAMP domain-containing sensor histidine kinase [Adlercreutzia sp. ZJ141]
MGAVAHGERQAAHSMRHGMPLALVIVRYFAYVLAAAVVLLVVAFGAFAIMNGSGLVYTANYAENNVEATVAALEAGQLDPAETPACYRWAVFDKQGSFVASDLSDDGVRELRSALERAGVFEREATTIRLDGNASRCTFATLPDGSLCVLQYDFLPDFASRSLRDALPNPQNLIIAAYCALFALSVVLVAMRASRVISRKMRPLVQVAERIEHQELDFSVTPASVREVNDVLVAMDRMRAALSESLKAQWAADEAQRRQVAALAHDVKTPLSIARWNADLLAESNLDASQRACVEGVRLGVERMESYVRTMLEVSRSTANVSSRTSYPVQSAVDVGAFVQVIEREARVLCDTRGVALDFTCLIDGGLKTTAYSYRGVPSVSNATRSDGEGEDLVRAVMNLVGNAVEHAPTHTTVHVSISATEPAIVAGSLTENEQTDVVDSVITSAVATGLLTIVVEDEGPGFSRDALAHATERFFTEWSDRNHASGHYGLGLSIASDIIRAHGGKLTLENAPLGGARCTMEVPVCTRYE